METYVIILKPIIKTSDDNFIMANLYMIISSKIVIIVLYICLYCLLFVWAWITFFIFHQIGCFFRDILRPVYVCFS